MGYEAEQKRWEDILAAAQAQIDSLEGSLDSGSYRMEGRTYHEVSQILEGMRTYRAHLEARRDEVLAERFSDRVCVPA